MGAALISMVKGEPALLIRNAKALVVADLHIGLDLKYKEKGMFFPNATERMAADIRRLLKKTGAKSLVILGDVKESIAYPKFAEFMELRRFFETLKGVRISIVKGNHDGDLEKVMGNFAPDIEITKEKIMGCVALVHGNAWPSEQAMRQRYLISAHGHFAVDVDGKNEKAWLFAKAGKGMGKRYGRSNKNIRLVIMPAFNDLILGTQVSEDTKNRTQFFRQDVFDWKSSIAYDLKRTKKGR